MGARESECQLSQNYIVYMKFSEIYLTVFLQFDIHFLGLPWEIFFGVIADD